MAMARNRNIHQFRIALGEPVSPHHAYLNPSFSIHHTFTVNSKNIVACMRLAYP